ncbi:MAG: alpha/beta hydrolase [Alphaproteobacteria bacterium]
MSGISKDAASGLEFIVVGETVNPKHILVVLHGTGDNCEGIKPVGDLFAKTLSDTLVLIPNGPVPLSAIFPPEQLEATKQANPGFDPEAARNWAGPSKIVPTDEESMARMVDDVMTPPVTALNTLIDGQLQKFGLTHENLVVYGFSAGGMLALHSSIARDEPCAAVVSHSGHFLGADYAASKPNTLMIFGDQEMANPQLKMLFSGSADYLRAMGLAVEEHICKDLGHGLNREAFDTAQKFIAESLGMELDTPAVTPKSKPAAPKPPQL